MNKIEKMSKVVEAIREFLDGDTEVKNLIVYDENTVEVTYTNGYVRDIDVTGLNSLETLIKVANVL